MLEKRLVGFGEMFRYLTYQDIGSPAIMSRATAGIIKGRILFSTPGSENAVRLAMEKSASFPNSVTSCSSFPNDNALSAHTLLNRK